MSTFLCTVNYPDGTSKEFTVENIYKLKYKDFAKQLKISKDQVLILENTIISSDKEFENLKSGCHLRVMSKKAFLESQKRVSTLHSSKNVVRANEQDRQKIVDTLSTEVDAFLKVDVLEAKNLPPMDMTNTSDPFVLLNLEGTSFTYKTNKKLKTLNPIWTDESCLFPIFANKPANLLVSVYDWDRNTSDDYIGSCQIDVSQFDYEERSQWFTLVYFNKKKNQTKNRGEIHLRFKLKNKWEANRKIFGSPLQQVLVVGNNQTVDIPIFCEQAISEIEKRGLDQEGIGRISGSAPKIEEYKNAIDDDRSVDLSNEDVHIICGLLKLYLRELPEPLFTFDLYNDFLESRSDLKSLQELLNKLPRPNKMLLRRLLILFGKIAAYTHLNKMTAATIATVFGPNLMFTKNLDPIESLKDSQAINELVYNLINYSSSIQWDPTDHHTTMVRKSVFFDRNTVLQNLNEEEK